MKMKILVNTQIDYWIDKELLICQYDESEEELLLGRIIVSIKNEKLIGIDYGKIET